MFLLRKKYNIPPAIPPSLVFINDLDCSWLEQLKTKVKEINSAPDEARLWIAASEDVNGLVGFITCLRKEEGGSKVRGILISNLSSDSSQPQISTDSAEFQV